MNTVRPDCVGVINPHTFARSSEYSSLRWVGRTPHVRRPACGAGVDVDWCPLCFIHFEGRAKETHAERFRGWVRAARLCNFLSFFRAIGRPFVGVFGWIPLP